VALIIVFALLIRLPLLLTPLTYGSDIWRQADTASIAHNFVGSYDLFYPQINWGGAGPGYVETEFQLYPFVVSLLYALLGERLWLGRLVSLSLTIPTSVLFYLLARRALGPKIAVWSLAFFVISPLYIRYSSAFMPEATVLFFYVAALYLFQKWLDEQRPSILLAASITTSLAILVKPTSIHIGLIFALLAIKQYGWGVLREWVVWLSALISLVPSVLWYLHARNLYLKYGNTFGLLSGGDSKFGNLDYWFGVHFYLSIARLDTKWVLAGVGAILFLVGFMLSLKERRYPLLRFGLVTILIYYMIVARYAQEEWGIQYHIYAVPFSALGVGIGFDWLYHHARRIPGPKTALLLAFLTLVGSAYLYLGMLRATNNDLIGCAGLVKQFVPEDAHLIVSTTSPAIINGASNNYQEPVIFFYSHRYGWSLPRDWHIPQKIEAFRQAGATHFVIYSQELYRASPELANYLKKNAEQIGPGIEAGCAIFQFKS
jgi:4-amino-4-deoxy-L-arabinose transferase-like glycosyltransferase